MEKNPVEKLSKVLEIELKTYTPVGPKFVFEKINFIVLYYIQHDFICQRPGLSKDQISMFKRRQTFFSKSRCGKCYLEIKGMVERWDPVPGTQDPRHPRDSPGPPEPTIFLGM